MPKLIVDRLEFTQAKWSKTSAKIGEEVELSVTAPTLTQDQSIQFRIYEDEAVLDTVVVPTGKTTSKWTVPFFVADATLALEAYLCEKPGPANGHENIRQWLFSLADLTVQRCSLTLGAVDAAFVPKQEQLSVAYTVVDPDAVAKQGRYEIWGERYPTDKPLYTLDFTPAAGDKTWADWDGKANAGVLNNKYITPEFSPYRVRVIIGLDDEAIADPFGAGLGKCVVAEKPFEVTFQSILVRLQAGLQGGQKAALDHALAIEPRQANGTFAEMGRLPLQTEANAGRIRIPGDRFLVDGESLNQACSNAGDPVNDGAGHIRLHRVADGYTDGGSTRFAIETLCYTRPELPLEIEARLRSRDPSKNKDGNNHPTGLFEKEAVGPAIFDVLVDIPYHDDLYDHFSVPAHWDYFKRAALSVKRGTHDVPFQTGAHLPEIGFWQQRFKINADGDQDIGNTDQSYLKGSTELTVYLNRTKLTLDLDYTEDSAVNNGDAARKIKLKEKLSLKDDVVWIIRVPAAASGQPWEVARWNQFPPGDNCHEYYGGTRGKLPTAELVDGLRKAYSNDPGGGFQPILGKGTDAFPYTATNTIDLDPAQVAEGLRELVTSQAVTATGNQQGLAGILFSPSFIGW